MPDVPAVWFDDRTVSMTDPEVTVSGVVTSVLTLAKVDDVWVQVDDPTVTAA